MGMAWTCVQPSDPVAGAGKVFHPHHTGPEGRRGWLQTPCYRACLFLFYAIEAWWHLINCLYRGHAQVEALLLCAMQLDVPYGQSVELRSYLLPQSDRHTSMVNRTR